MNRPVAIVSRQYEHLQKDSETIRKVGGFDRRTDGTSDIPYPDSRRAQLAIDLRYGVAITLPAGDRPGAQNGLAVQLLHGQCGYEMKLPMRRRH